MHYVLDGSTIVSETRKDGYDMVTHQFYYYYDENGAPIGLNWNGQDYYYYKNIFGDILGIFNSAGTLVVRYSYDAWGCNLGVTGTMATTLGRYNPFRYRGYYLDTETGMYYLNARYYNPYWCRFISPAPVIDASNAVGCNLFAYCGNDPVNRVDPSGEFWFTVLLVTAIISICTLSLSGCSETPAPRRDLAAAPSLDIQTASPDSYNCYGNGIGKQIVADPSRYEIGDSTRKTFEAVKKDLGANNVRELESIRKVHLLFD